MKNYIVKKGDNLTKIAKNHGMTLEQLMKLNNISADQANYIQVGQILKVQDINLDKPQITIDPNYQIPRATFNPGQSSTYVATPLVVKSTPTQSTTETLRPKPIDQATYLKNNAKDVQNQLLSLGYNLGKWGADGNWGNTSQAAFDQAVKDGYAFKDGKFISIKPRLKPKTPPRTLEEAVQQNPVYQRRQMIEQFSEQPITTIQTSEQPISVNNSSNLEIRKFVPRAYTAFQNTVDDVIAAPLKRKLGEWISPDFANKILPTQEFNENHLSNELYTWLQEAIDKKWDPSERKKYFEEHPDVTVKKGWKGRTNDEVKQSDYKTYYNIDYGGPVKNGIINTMFGDGIDQAQGTLGSFDIVYTPDGAYIEDTWDFEGSNEFDNSTLVGSIRSFAENNGSQENSDIQPVRSIKAKIKYR